MRRLWVQLAFAFGAITLVSVALVAWMANVRTNADFRSFMGRSAVLEANLPAELSTFYAAQGSWAGVDQLLKDVRFGAGQGSGFGSMAGNGRGLRNQGSNSLVLTDAAGRVVYASTTPVSNTLLTSRELAEGVPIETTGTVVGYLVLRTAANSALPLAAERFLAQINLALIQTGVFVGVVGIGLGILVARSLVAPLSSLVGAARQIAHGDLSQRIPQSGPTEVAEAAQAFNEMVAALETSETERRRMVADIAHELRTPLTVIQGNLRAILDEVYPLSRAEIATIYDATLGLHHLVDDLRELSLAEAGQLRLNRDHVELADIIEHSVALFTDLATQQQVELRADLAPDLAPVNADPHRIAQVLNNLVANALRYTPPGGRVVIKAEPATDSADAICISVSDTGSGIAPADLPHVFDRFWRADRSRSRGQGGSGLGLAIAYQIVALHEGTMGVTSRLDTGSRFWFALPIVPTARR